MIQFFFFFAISPTHNDKLHSLLFLTRTLQFLSPAKNFNNSMKWSGLKTNMTSSCLFARIFLPLHMHSFIHSFFVCASSWSGAWIHWEHWVQDGNTDPGWDALHMIIKSSLNTFQYSSACHWLNVSFMFLIFAVVHVLYHLAFWLMIYGF